MRVLTKERKRVPSLSLARVASARQSGSRPFVPRRENRYVRPTCEEADSTVNRTALTIAAVASGVFASGVFASGACASSALAQASPEWTTPFPPFRIADHLYYVGSKGLASYLVTTPQGHILINSDLEANVPLIRESIDPAGLQVQRREDPVDQPRALGS